MDSSSKKNTQLSVAVVETHIMAVLSPLQSLCGRSTMPRREFITALRTDTHVQKALWEDGLDAFRQFAAANELPQYKSNPAGLFAATIEYVLCRLGMTDKKFPGQPREIDLGSSVSIRNAWQQFCQCAANFVYAEGLREDHLFAAEVLQDDLDRYPKVDAATAAVLEAAPQRLAWYRSHEAALARIEDVAQRYEPTPTMLVRNVPALLAFVDHHGVTLDALVARVSAPHGIPTASTWKDLSNLVAAIGAKSRPMTSADLDLLLALRSKGDGMRWAVTAWRYALLSGVPVPTCLEWLRDTETLTKAAWEGMIGKYLGKEHVGVGAVVAPPPAPELTPRQRIRVEVTARLFEHGGSEANLEHLVGLLTALKDPAASDDSLAALLSKLWEKSPRLQAIPLGK